MLDLLNTAARSLVLKGRLAYLIPTTYDFTIDDLPKHPCLEIVSICEQPLSTRHGRRCVVMEKAHRCTENLLEEFRVYKELVLAGKDNGFGKLSLKLERALASNPLDTDDGVVKHVSKSAMKRKQSRVRRVESILKLQKENANTTTITADQGTYFMDQNDNLDG